MLHRYICFGGAELQLGAERYLVPEVLFKSSSFSLPGFSKTEGLPKIRLIRGSAYRNSAYRTFQKKFGSI